MASTIHIIAGKMNLKKESRSGQGYTAEKARQVVSLSSVGVVKRGRDLLENDVGTEETITLRFS